MQVCPIILLGNQDFDGPNKIYLLSTAKNFFNSTTRTESCQVSCLLGPYHSSYSSTFYYQSGEKPSEYIQSSLVANQSLSTLGPFVLWIIMIYHKIIGDGNLQSQNNQR